MTDDFFITPHAIEQFQKRIARLSDDEARAVIYDGICQATNVRVLPDGETLRVRTRRPFPFEFRAYCVFDHIRRHRVVTTVVRGDSRATRQHKFGVRQLVAAFAGEGKPAYSGKQSGNKLPHSAESADKSAHSIKSGNKLPHSI